MAISINDLDHIIGYDPDTHTVKGLPGRVDGPVQSFQPTPDAARHADAQIADLARKRAGLPTLSSLAPANATARATPRPAPAETPVAAAPGIPSLNAMNAPALPVSGGIPSLSAPTRAQSKMAGAAEYEGTIPKITAMAGTPEFYQEQLARSEFQREHPEGSNVSKDNSTWGKIKHGLAVAGNVAGNAVDPGLMATIPGTELNRNVNEARATKNLAGAEENQLKEAEAAGWAPITVTGPHGEQITTTLRGAGAAGIAGLKADTSERNAGLGAATKLETTGENIAGKAANTATTESGKNTREDKALQTKRELTADELKTREKIAQEHPAGSYQPLFDPQTQAITGWYNTKNPGERLDPGGSAAAAGAAPAGTTGTGARMNAMDQNRFNTQYINPANQTETQYQRAKQAVDEYNNNPKTGATGMVIFAQHLSTTLGGIKGAAIGEGAQKMHLDAIGLEDRAKRFIDQMQTGQPLSANQVHDFMDLIKKTRDLQWETTTREAVRRKQPLDFLPGDVQIRLTSPDGKETQAVPADRVQEFVDKGGKVGY